MRLDEIETLPGTRLDEIPDSPLIYDDIEKQANEEFDYAQKEQISLAESSKRVRENVMAENIRRNSFDVQKAWPEIEGIAKGSNFDFGNIGTLEQLYDPSPGEFTIGEKFYEVAKAGQEGLVGLGKLPGVALKALGESGFTNEEIAAMGNSRWMINQKRVAFLQSPTGKKVRQSLDMIRKAGNKYIDFTNGFRVEMSDEARVQMEQPFMAAPGFRTIRAVAESAPSYGLAVASTLASGGGSIGLYLLGTTTASQAYEKYRESMIDPDLALVAALTEGSIEVLTEKVPMNELMRGGGRSLLTRFLRLGTFESAQELLAQLGQNYTDAVTRDIDPEKMESVLQAARQEWSVISQSWQDAMAAGFVMGGGASIVSGNAPEPTQYRTEAEMRGLYEQRPTVQDFQSKVEEIRQKVKEIEKAQQEAEKPVTQAVEPSKPPAPSTEGEGKLDTAFAMLENAPIEEIPIDLIKLSKDVPNFKEMADEKTGVVRGEELKGKYTRAGTPPIVVWERADGTLEVVSGRHRLDLARRSGEKTIRAQRAKESEGFTKEFALTVDAEMNIMDEKGLVKDYVHYFRNTRITREEAEAKGLLSRTKGEVGFVIAKGASDDTTTGYFTGQLTESKAYAIAKGAPNNDSAQNAALAKAKSYSPEQLEQYAKILHRMTPEDKKTAQQGDLFGFDDSALKEAEAVSKEVGKEIKQINDRIMAVKGALKRPEAARKMGLEFSDEAATRKEVERLEGRLDALSRTSTTPELFEEMRQRAGLAKQKKTLLDNLSDDEKSELEKLEGKLKDKIKNQLNVGLDPELFVLATKIGSFYVKAGYRAFSQWAAQVKSRVGDISIYTLRTIYANLRNEYPDLDSDADIDASMVLPVGQEIGEGEEKVRGTSASVMAQAIRDDLIAEEKGLSEEDLPTYLTMGIAEKADMALSLIQKDLDRAIRIAYYQENALAGLYPENVFSALRTYARMTGDVNLIMKLATDEEAARAHTILGQRIKSLDTGENYADPVRAIREIVDARKEQRARAEGKKVSELEAELRQLKGELSRLEAEKIQYVQKIKREYGSRNKLVKRAEYDAIMARRKPVSLKELITSESGVAPNAQDLADVAKIGLFHLEAMGRDFAKWSWQMTRDLGDWVKPYLQDEYDKALQTARESGIEIPESKRLSTKKKRLATMTEKMESQYQAGDFEKSTRFPIELDEEGHRLQEAYNVAKAKLQTAQKVANVITEEEVRIIAQLAKDVADRKQEMEGGKRRGENESATDDEMQYGMTLYLFHQYVNDLVKKANKRIFGETINHYFEYPGKFINDLFGTFKAAKGSLDNSFHGRQGLNTFMKGITGDIQSAKIWINTFLKSWKFMYDTLKHKEVMHLLYAEIVSDPDYDLLKKSKVDINVIEEEIPVDILSRIPLLGMLFRMGENAFVGSSRYMRYQVTKQYIRVARHSGLELSKQNLERIGRLANSQTGRGQVKGGKEPGIINNVLWSPRNIRADVDTLTAHLFTNDMGSILPWRLSWARKQAALNLLRRIAGTAMILALADWLDDDSVTWDTTNSDFGKIRIGNTRFSVAGSLGPIIVLASRLITRKYTSSTTGKTEPFNKRMTGTDFVYDYFENKYSPATQLIFSVIDRATRDGDKLSVPQLTSDAFTPLLIQNVLESSNVEDSANIIAVLMAEALGMNVQSYEPKKSTKSTRERGKW